MNLIKSKSLADPYKNQIFKLWNTVYPKSLNHPNIADFEAYLSKLNDKTHLFLVDEHDKVLAWYIDFMREKEPNFAILVSQDQKRIGLGTKLLNLGKKRNNNLFGWVIDHDNALLENGKPYLSPLNFYLKNDFVLIPEKRLELPNISAVKIHWKK